MEVVTDIHMVLEQLAGMRHTLLPLYFITKAIFLMYSLDLTMTTPLDPFFIGCFCEHASIDSFSKGELSQK